MANQRNPTKDQVVTDEELIREGEELLAELRNHRCSGCYSAAEIEQVQSEAEAQLLRLKARLAEDKRIARAIAEFMLDDAMTRAKARTFVKRGLVGGFSTRELREVQSGRTRLEWAEEAVRRADPFIEDELALLRAGASAAVARSPLSRNRSAHAIAGVGELLSGLLASGVQHRFVVAAGNDEARYGGEESVSHRQTDGRSAMGGLAPCTSEPGADEFLDLSGEGRGTSLRVRRA
jgi:hypothetical protein